MRVKRRRKVLIRFLGEHPTTEITRRLCRNKLKFFPGPIRRTISPFRLKLTDRTEFSIDNVTGPGDDPTRIP